MIYLDNSSTTKPYDEVCKKMAEALSLNWGNPSSLHKLGFTAEKELKEARKIIADTLGKNPEEIYFTSGGTEADNMFIQGMAYAKARSGLSLITSNVEHPAALEAFKTLDAERDGFKVTYLPVDNRCMLSRDAFIEALNPDTTVISVMCVNNESGVIFPINEMAKIVKEYNQANGTNIMLHTDAVQAYGKLDVENLKVDAMSISSHKIHGPKGVGALYMAKNAHLIPILYGGGQEKNVRPGTENMPGIIGFGEAAKILHRDFEENGKKMATVRNYLLAGIKSEIKDIIINSPEEVRRDASKLGFDDYYSVPSVLNVSFLGTRGEVLLHTLEQDDIYISTGSACSSNKSGDSHVLQAMGLNHKEIEGALRFSFNEFNTTEEMDIVLDKLKAAVSKFRKLGSFR
ncbi:MAG: cysteine desulfurase [Clostridia bacterium]|nr:cysteine desulfurase [Clostridia bacterium]